MSVTQSLTIALLGDLFPQLRGILTFFLNSSWSIKWFRANEYSLMLSWLIHTGLSLFCVLTSWKLTSDWTSWSRPLMSWSSVTESHCPSLSVGTTVNPGTSSRQLSQWLVTAGPAVLLTHTDLTTLPSWLHYSQPTQGNFSSGWISVHHLTFWRSPNVCDQRKLHDNTEKWFWSREYRNNELIHYYSLGLRVARDKVWGLESEEE